jgi:hypothetical protein
MWSDRPFGILLARASLCLDLDCNTVFDFSISARCPGCGSAEFFPLSGWLNVNATRQQPATPRLIVSQAA